MRTQQEDSWCKQYRRHRVPFRLVKSISFSDVRFIHFTKAFEIVCNKVVKCPEMRQKRVKSTERSMPFLFINVLVTG